MKRRGRVRWLLICLAVVVGLGGAGIAYGYSAGTLRAGDLVATACYTPCPPPSCTDPITWVVSNDDGKVSVISPYGAIDPGDDGGGTNYDRWGDQSSNDPSEPQTLGIPGNRYDKDVARTRAWKSCKPQKITVLIENAYPCYYPTVFFGLKCCHSPSGTIKQIVVNNPYPDQLAVTVSGIYKGQPIPQCREVTGALHVHVKQPARQNAVYTFTVTITIECAPSIRCETAYAYGGKWYGKCFSLYGFRNWGWTNGPLSTGNYTFELWAGAAGWDTSKGKLVGWVTVDYNGSRAIVTYNVYSGNYMTATHLYVGNDRLPRDKNGKETVAPGQYPYKHDPLNNVTTDTYTVNGLSGKIYVIAHAKVCWQSGGGWWNWKPWGWGWWSWGGWWQWKWW